VVGLPSTEPCRRCGHIVRVVVVGLVWLLRGLWGFCFFFGWGELAGLHTSHVVVILRCRANFYLKTRGESITDLYMDFKNGGFRVGLSPLPQCPPVACWDVLPFSLLSMASQASHFCVHCLVQPRDSLGPRALVPHSRDCQPQYLLPLVPGQV
jgi:hypothetical protein